MTALLKQVLHSVLIIALLCNVFIMSAELINGVQTAKYFYAIVLMFTVFPLFVAVSAFRQKPVVLHVRSIDIALTVFVLYSAIRFAATPHISIYNTRFTTLIFSFAAYIFFRFFFEKKSDSEYSLHTIKKHESLIKLVFVCVLSIAIVASVHGNLQLYGIYPSHHALFRVSGTFFNPGPYAGYLAIIFPFAVGCFIFTPQKTIADKILRYTALTAMAAIFLILPVTRSRAAWLAATAGTLYVLAYRYKPWQRIKPYLAGAVKQTALAVVLATALVFMAHTLYNLKPASADGRLFTWKLSAQMIAEKPLFGHGYDRFSVAFANHQAAYFAQQKAGGTLNETETMIAGSGEYCFNEYLQTAVETGLVGLLLMLLPFVLAFYNIKPTTANVSNTKKHEVGGLALAPAIKTHAGSVTEQNKQLVDFTLAPAIKTHNVGLVAFMVFAFFSYPLSMIPLYTLIIFWLAVAASNTGKAYSIQLPAVLHYSLAAATLPLFAFLLHTNLQSLGAHKQWKTAHSLLQSGIYTKAATEYQKLNNILGHEPQFAHQYGKALVLGKQTTAGISILEQAKTICADPYLYCTLGNAYKAEGEYKKAATAYQYAANIIPHKFYAEYLLAKLYNDSGQTPLAIQTAKALLAKKVKVPSPAITDIKEAMREIIKTTIP